MDRLLDIIAKLFGLPRAEVSAETSMKNTAAWDSLRHMELIVTIEQEYGVNLTEDDIISMVDVQSIFKVLQGYGKN